MLIMIILTLILPLLFHEISNNFGKNIKEIKYIVMSFYPLKFTFIYHN